MANLHGNHACALGAIAAGCRFFAGYPITPSSEIAERMSRELPLVGGTFVQMEDEIASMAAVLGASAGGVKSMTATSGPGFSLKQENIGLASMAEIPCVIANVMRGGPSTGMPTRPAQSDIMQARWGSHGDHPLIALAPASVKEIHDQTIRAFNLSERYRVPVMVLFDQVIAHLLEPIELPAAGSLDLVERRWANGDDGYQPYAAGADGIPAMTRPGDGHRTHTTGLTHAEDGFPTQDPDTVTRVMDRLLGKLDQHGQDIEAFECHDTKDAEVLVVAYGISARAARRAVRQARERGIAAGLFRPITLWPFPEQALRTAADQARSVLVPEMNAGQLVLEVERICRDEVRVAGLNRVDGQPIEPSQIARRIEEMAADD
ncbi:MAG: 2-oxoacid:acceptor oxidoreductase subunit alpha [Alphaproteobacteria bacterium]|nr:2-oxoacid:acceptor oxidoreductase subunit alpha [Alphaproteobacteria bacterium]MDP6812693.1 2-oxoacid:acceptor oxidoreductase subunit alpha [Alphaproteobacteria bacterium]